MEEYRWSSGQIVRWQWTKKFFLNRIELKWTENKTIAIDINVTTGQHITLTKDEMNSTDKDVNVSYDHHHAMMIEPLKTTMMMDFFFVELFSGFVGIVVFVERSIHCISLYTSHTRARVLTHACSRVRECVYHSIPQSIVCVCVVMSQYVSNSFFFYWKCCWSC